MKKSYIEYFTDVLLNIIREIRAYKKFSGHITKIAWKKESRRCTLLRIPRGNIKFHFCLQLNGRKINLGTFFTSQ